MYLLTPRDLVMAATFFHSANISELVEATSMDPNATDRAPTDDPTGPAAPADGRAVVPVETGTAQAG